VRAREKRKALGAGCSRSQGDKEERRRKQKETATKTGRRGRAGAKYFITGTNYCVAARTPDDKRIFALPCRSNASLFFSPVAVSKA
jgi:hypothetical protein